MSVVTRSPQLRQNWASGGSEASQDLQRYLYRAKVGELQCRRPGLFLLVRLARHTRGVHDPVERGRIFVDGSQEGVLVLLRRNRHLIHLLPGRLMPFLAVRQRRYHGGESCGQRAEQSRHAAAARRG